MKGNAVSENACVSQSFWSAAASCNVPARACSLCTLIYSKMSVACRPTHSRVSCSPPCTQHKGTSAAVGLFPKKAKQRGLVSVLSIGQSEKHLQITLEAFHVLTGGPGRVQAPKQAMDCLSPKWTQGVAVSHRKAMVQASSKWCND